MHIKIESLTVHDANGQPYKLADAIFDVEAVRRMAEELAAARRALDPDDALSSLSVAEIAVLQSIKP